jgi:hypothetical protein
MSSFASIKFIKEYEKVVFYSVVINGGEDEEQGADLYRRRPDYEQ